MMRALITGATSGIGRAIAMEFSRRGWALVLTGRNQKALEELQQMLPVPTEIIALDLAEDQAPFALYEFCRGKRIDVLVNNAGFGVFGEFTETDLQQELELLQVNIRALHILTKLFLREFQKRGSGRILNVASSAGFLTGPLLSSYYASKNYVVRLSLAIAEELRHQHSRVTISVAKEAVFGVLTGKLIIIPGMLNQLGIFASRFVPQQLMSRITYYIQAAKRN